MFTYTTVGDWFYYPQTGKYYRYTDIRVVGTDALLSRACDVKDKI